jgi:hypothetical protein
MAYFVFVFSRIAAKALVIFCARWSKLPAQPTQNKISGLSPCAIISAIVGTCISVGFQKANVVK